jgi:homoserine kinase type II
MALTTPMTLAEAERIGERFGLTVVALEPLARGVNSNFAFTLAGGERVFARVHEQVGEAAVQRHNRLVAHLAGRGVPTPAPLPRLDGGTIASHRGKPLALFRFRPGDLLCQARVTPRHARLVGEALGRIHRAGEGYSHAPINAYGVEDLRGRLAALEARSLPDEVRADVAHLGDRLADLRVSSRANAPAPALGVIHGDLFRDNVLWNDGELSAVLDFEYASAGLAAFDLAVTLLAWCFGDRLEPTLARELCAGYQSVRALTAAELGGAYDQARLAALRFAVSRISDYELKPRGSIAFKDYRRFVARLAAVEAIGRDAFAAWLGGAGAADVR